MLGQTQDFQNPVEIGRCVAGLVVQRQHVFNAGQYPAMRGGNGGEINIADVRGSGLSQRLLITQAMLACPCRREMRH